MASEALLTSANGVKVSEFTPAEDDTTPSIPSLVATMNRMAETQPDLYRYGLAYDWDTYWNKQGVFRMFETIKAIYLSNAKEASFGRLAARGRVFSILRIIWSGRSQSDLLAAINAVECMQQISVACDAPGDRSRELIFSASKGFDCASFDDIGIQAKLDCTNTSSTMLSLINLYTFMFVVCFPYDAGNSLMRDFTIERSLLKQDPQQAPLKWMWDPAMFSNENMLSAARFNYVYVDQLFPRNGEPVSFENSFKERVLVSAFRSTLTGLLVILKQDCETVKAVEVKILGLTLTFIFSLISFVMNRMLHGGDDS